MSMFDVFRIKKIKQENERLHLSEQNLNSKLEKLAVYTKKLKKALKNTGGLEPFEIDLLINSLKKQKIELEQRINSYSKIIETQNLQIAEKRNTLLVLDDEVMFEEFALYKPKFDFMSSDRFKMELDTVRKSQKQLIKDCEAVSCASDWVINNSKTEGKKVVKDIAKLLLRSFNNECDICVGSVRFDNVERHSERIVKSYDTINKCGESMSVSISSKYLDLKLKELYLAHEFQLKKQEEKEEQKRFRDDLREQVRIERELHEARNRIAKERQQYSNAIQDIRVKLLNSINETEKQKLEDKLINYQNCVDKLDKEESVVDYREKNAKAGYIYIISNIGAFGEDVYKIGMTRRLEPMDRIDELGDASVPFSFDVHALIFSANAPELEAKLHQHFQHRRLNKMNNRKEFFRVNIKEIIRVVRDNYSDVVDINEVPTAEEYRESLKLK